MLKPALINPDLFILFQEMEMWEDRYREKHCMGKSDEELTEAGWWKDNFGEWYCMQLGKERERKFRKKLYQFFQVSRTDSTFPGPGPNTLPKGCLSQRPE